MTVPAEGGAAQKTSLFEGSTHFRNWRFSPEQLAATRASMNATAVAAIRATFEADEVRMPTRRLTRIWG